MRISALIALVAVFLQGNAAPREQRVPVASTSLYARVVGSGQSLIVLHGGPDFDHKYLLPDLDRLANGYQLIYYDQRGRGLSANGVRPSDVSMSSEVEDLDTVRRQFKVESAALLGHSWGTVLALEYALRHPDRVSHLILMNPAPASSADFTALRKFYLMAETWEKSSYNLLPKLAALKIPTVVIYGDHDFIPMETSAHIAKAIPRARFVALRGCGHFTYLECPGEVRRVVDELFRQ